MTQYMPIPIFLDWRMSFKELLATITVFSLIIILILKIKQRDYLWIGLILAIFLIAIIMLLIKHQKRERKLKKLDEIYDKKIKQIANKKNKYYIKKHTR